MFETIVVGTDGSETASKAVRAAAELAKSGNGRVHIVSAYEPVAGARVSRATGPELPDASYSTSEVQAVIDDAGGLVHSMGVEYATYARRGNAAEVILDVAEEQNADVIVVGNRGMKGPKRFLLGSVPNKVSHHAQCSVIIVRTV